MRFGVILCLVGIISFSLWPLWDKLQRRAASDALQARVRALVEKHPELKPAFNIAQHDGVLTYPEAKEIVEGAGEKVGPDE